MSESDLQNAALLVALSTLSFGLSWWLSTQLARGRWLVAMDHPNERSLHEAPTPRTGGIAIMAALIVALAPIVWIYGAAFGGIFETLAVAGAVLAILSVSIVDDFRNVSVLWRLCVHAGAALLLVAAGLSLNSVELPGVQWLIPAPAAVVVTVLIVLWMVNLYNFMDGMDGLAGGMGAIGFAAMAMLGAAAGDWLFAALCTAVAAACCGFLMVNFAPARIFMGDAGASVLGLLAAIAALKAQRDGLFPLWLSLLVFSPFIVDATVTLLRRLLGAEKVWKAHRSHFYQRVVILGWTHRRTCALEYMLMIGCAVSALCIRQAEVSLQIAVLLTWAATYGILMLTITAMEKKARILVNLYDKLGRLRTRSAAFLHDVLMIPCSWLGALWLRFNLESVPQEYLSAAWAAVPMVMVVQGAVFWYYGLYRGVWRFASLPDLLRIVKAIVVGVCLVALGLFLATRMQGIPRSMFPLYAVLLLLALGGPRLLYRWFKDRRIYAPAIANTLVVGAGRAGEMLVRDLLRNPAFGYQPVGFIDDDVNKKGREIHGVRVLGNSSKIERLCERLNVDMVLLAIPSASSEQMRKMVEYCERANVPMKTLPSIKDLPSGRAGWSSLREISIEDLLGREPVSLDWKSITAGIERKTVLVTGGGGSIGAELCRQIGKLNPERLVIYDASEFNVYQIERELKVLLPELKVHALLGDVCDQARLEQVFAEFRPTLVLHAAAYKHVPMLENQARQAVRNNVLGTRATATTAARHGCKTFVLISTDKAVNPTNVMGASKRLAEMCCQQCDLQSNGTSFVIVRFGNVLDSAGSVVPLFREQIAQGGPVTVTHPEVKRYFMTIPEACQLILQAAAVGRGGELFVLDMGEPVSINYLARQMILLAGKVPGSDVEIQFTGLRPGEKLFEELFHSGETFRGSQHEKLFLAKSRDIDWKRFEVELQELERACEAVDEASVRKLLGALVPEFGPSPSTNENVIELNRARSESSSA